MDNSTLITSLNNHLVYYVSDNDFSFCIGLPRKKRKTAMTIELRPDHSEFNIENNTNVSIEKIINYYNKIDAYDITLIVPIFNNNILEDVRNNASIENFNKLDSLLSKFFNASYKFLVNNNYEVTSTINIVNNDNCKVFLTWFVSKYQSRVDYASLLELIRKTTKNEDNYNKIEASGVSFVVGSPKTEKKLEEEKVIKEVMSEVAKIEPVPTQIAPVNKAGYVSYVVLGLVSVTLSLLLLYILVR